VLTDRRRPRTARRGRHLCGTTRTGPYQFPLCPTPAADIGAPGLAGTVETQQSAGRVGAGNSESRHSCCSDRGGGRRLHEHPRTAAIGHHLRDLLSRPPTADAGHDPVVAQCWSFGRTTRRSRCPASRRWYVGSPRRDALHHRRRCRRPLAPPRVPSFPSSPAPRQHFDRLTFRPFIGGKCEMDDAARRADRLHIEALLELLQPVPEAFAASEDNGHDR